MLESLAVVAVAVLVVLTFGSLLPFVPSGVLSAVTVIAYWWQTGYTEPNILIVVSLVLLGILVTVTDFASGAVAGKLGGASNESVITGSIVGLILLFVVGPIGFIAGIALVVFAFSVYREEDNTETALKKSLYTVIGVLASKIVQFVLLLVMTATFSFFVLI